jgi:hypothetical protein
VVSDAGAEQQGAQGLDGRGERWYSAIGWNRPGIDGGGLPGAVRAGQGGDRSVRDGRVDAAQDGLVAIGLPRPVRPGEIGRARARRRRRQARSVMTRHETVSGGTAERSPDH